MLNKKYKHFLDHLIKNQERADIGEWGFSFTCVASLSSISEFEACNIADFLVQQNYLCYAKTDHDRAVGIHLTERGQNYKKFLRQEFWLTALKSVFLPIILALITTLITLSLKGELFNLFPPQVP